MQELLFCETCDTVFCTLCTGGSHIPGGGDDSTSVQTGQMTLTPGMSTATVNTVTTTTGQSGTPTHSGTSAQDHTVIPFSIAIKRMSEILIYKANECRAKVSSLAQPRDIQFLTYFSLS